MPHVTVNQQNALALLGKGCGEVDGHRRLTLTRIRRCDDQDVRLIQLIWCHEGNVGGKTMEFLGGMTTRLYDHGRRTIGNGMRLRNRRQNRAIDNRLDIARLIDALIQHLLDDRTQQSNDQTGDDANGNTGRHIGGRRHQRLHRLLNGGQRHFNRRTQRTGQLLIQLPSGLLDDFDHLIRIRIKSHDLDHRRFLIDDRGYALPQLGDIAMQAKIIDDRLQHGIRLQNIRTQGRDG